MNRVFCYVTAFIWTAVAYWLFAMHNLGCALDSFPSIVLGMDPVVSNRAREQVYGREFSWYAFASMLALTIAIYCVIKGSKMMKKPPNQALVTTAMTQTPSATSPAPLSHL